MVPGVVEITELQRRKKIEDKYQASINAFREHHDIAVHLLKMELYVKCKVAESIRDQELNSGEEQWPRIA